MFHCNRTTRTFPLKAGMLLCAALVTDVAVAAPPKLQTVAVTPTAASIFVGQTQFFKATGTFSDGSTRALGPAIVDIAPGRVATCVLLNRGGGAVLGLQPVRPARRRHHGLILRSTSRQGDQHGHGGGPEPIRTCMRADVDPHRGAAPTGQEAALERLVDGERNLIGRRRAGRDDEREHQRSARES